MTIKIGLIGCGQWGRNHAKKLSLLSKMGECDFVGIADVNGEVAKVAEQFQVDFFSDIGYLLEKVDAVIVVVPTILHAEVVRTAFEAKKHVLVEKPMTLHSKKTKELLWLAQRTNLILSVGYLYRFHPVLIELKDLLPKIGKVHYVNARYTGGQNRLWADSGAILNFGIHVIDMLNFLFGSNTRGVLARKQNLLDAKREDSANILLSFETFHAVVELSCINRVKKREIEVIAENDTILADLKENTLKGCKSQVQYFEAVDPLFDELRYFVSLVGRHQSGSFYGAENKSEEDINTVLTCEAALGSD